MGKGVQFLIDEQGEKTAVVIDLKKHGVLREDFYDSAVAHARRDDPRETLEWGRCGAWVGDVWLRNHSFPDSAGRSRDSPFLLPAPSRQIRSIRGEWH